MAIKAGLVGVNPKGVDKNGMPLRAIGTVNETQLTANGKQFHFAYDETSEKYGGILCFSIQRPTKRHFRR